MATETRNAPATKIDTVGQFQAYSDIEIARITVKRLIAGAHES